MNKNLLLKVYKLIPKEDKPKLIWLLLGITFTGISEMLGIAAILPFIALIADNNAIYSNIILNTLFRWGGFSNVDFFLVCMGISVFLLILSANAISSLVSWLLIRFNHKLGHKLAVKLFQNYMLLPYKFFLNNNSSELSKNILSEIPRLVVGVFVPLMMVLSKVFLVGCIMLLLFINNPTLTLILMLTLGSCYSIIYVLIKKKLMHWGHSISEENAKRFKIAGEAFLGVKDVKIFGKEKYFIDAFSKPSSRMAAFMIRTETIPIVTRNLVEMMALGSFLVAVLYFLLNHYSIKALFPALSLYIFSGYRLMPAIQLIFTNATILKNNSPAVDLLLSDLNRMDNIISDNKFNHYEIKQGLFCKNVQFSYLDHLKPAVNEIDLFIPKNTIIGFVGKTGSGKTTAIDLLLGLLVPTDGEIMLDDITINQQNIRSYQKLIGYVPQNIFLLDDTIEKNIAFGLPEEEINHQRVIAAAQIANIDNFITELPLGYQHMIGERGVRLSGGQRQRIGLARALYRNYQVLILDEATSALDNLTEKRVISAIQQSCKDKIVIMIAHRLSTLEYCNMIYCFENGKIIQSGSYTEVVLNGVDLKEQELMEKR